MSKRNSKEYLGYALGEILLVVIGILIAFSINSWNEERKNSADETLFLQAFLDDLIEQEVVLEGQNDWESERITKVNQCLALVKSKQLDGKTDSLYSLINRLNPRKTFDVVNATYEELKSTGNFKLIQDKKLRKDIILFYQELEVKGRIIDNNNFNIDNIYKPFTTNNDLGFYYDAKGELALDWKKDPTLFIKTINMLNMRRALSNSNLMRTQIATIEVDELETRITDYLKEK